MKNKILWAIWFVFSCVLAWQLVHQDEDPMVVSYMQLHEFLKTPAQQYAMGETVP